MGRYSAKMFALCGVRPKFGALLSDVKRFFTYVQNDAKKTVAEIQKINRPRAARINSRGRLGYLIQSW